MAGLIGLTANDMEVQDALGAVHWDYQGQWAPHPVVRLTTTLPIAVQSEVREIRRARWGFPVSAGRAVGNCRDDKLTESPLWASMFGKRHCMVAATGIYEMVRENGIKTSYWFRRRDGRPIIMPGLVSERNIEGHLRLCCGIITTQPNQFFGRFHDRQVCVLEDDEMDAWMAAGHPGDMRRLLHAPADEDWEAVPVDNRIFQPGRRIMSDLQPLGAPLHA